MSENVYQSINGTTVIINGGDPEKDCPKTWEEAYAIEAKMNEGKQENCEPLWDFDCGFKLDFDGPLVKVSSRFYPPKSFDSKIWDGSVQIYMGNTDLGLREFNCETLEQLRSEVETYMNEIREKIKSVFE
jgi:hypothetical protein